jgi:hypothetical protein
MPRFADNRTDLSEHPLFPRRFAWVLSHLEEIAMANPTSRNEGEGNRTADRNYREATKNFVESERGQEEITKAGEVNADEAKVIRAAEEEAKSRAKEHDSQEVRKSNRPS